MTSDLDKMKNKIKLDFWKINKVDEAIIMLDFKVQT